MRAANCSAPPCVAPPADARLAAHLAFMAAANSARRSGEMFSFLFALRAGVGFGTTAARFTGVFRAATLALVFSGLEAFVGFRFFLMTADVALAPSFMVSLASFFASLVRRAFSRSIFFARFLRFFIGNRGIPATRDNERRMELRVNDEFPRMSRMFDCTL